jgi:hypothetical protein
VYQHDVMRAQYDVAFQAQQEWEGKFLLRAAVLDATRQWERRPGMVGTKKQVFHGEVLFFKRGQKKYGTISQLVQTHSGKIMLATVAATLHKHPWLVAVKRAREGLGIVGFQAVKKNTPLYQKAKQIMRAIQHDIDGGAHDVDI